MDINEPNRTHVFGLMASFESNSVTIPSIEFKWEEGGTLATDKYGIFVVLIIFLCIQSSIFLYFISIFIYLCI